MLPAQLTAVALSLILLVTIATSFFVFKKSHFRLSFYFLGLYFLGYALWTGGILANLLIYLANPIDYKFEFGSIPYLIEQILFLGAVIFHVGKLWFIQTYQENKMPRSIWQYWSIIFAVAISVVVLIPNTIFSYVSVQTSGWTMLGMESFAGLFSLFLFSYSVYIIFLIFIKKRKNRGSIFEKQFNLFLSAHLITFIFIYSLNWILPVYFEIFYLNALGPIATFISIGTFAYAATHYRFFSTNLITSKFLKAIFLIFSSIALAYFLLQGINSIFVLPPLYIIALIVVVLFGYNYLAYLFLRSDLFYRVFGITSIEHFQKTIKNFSSHNFLFTSLEELKTTLNNVFCKKLKIKFVNLLPLNHEIREKYPHLIQSCAQTRKILVTSELEFFKNQKLVNESLLQELKSLGQICLPLFQHSGKLIGFFVLGDKQFGGFYLKEEINSIKQLENYLSLKLMSVLYKTELQEQVSNQTKSIQQKNRKIQALNKQQKDFINVASHEFNTPTTILRLLVESLPESQQKKDLKFNLDRFCDKVIEVVKTHVYNNKNVTLELRKTNLKNYFAKFYASFKLLIQKDQKKPIQFNFDNKLEDDLEVPIDLTKIWQILENLIKNAINFTSKEDGIITLYTKATKKNIYIGLIDNGCGVPNSFKEAIFSKFRGSHSSRGHGLGLGLYLCREIVKMHHGKIWCEDAPLKSGAAFYIELPREWLEKEYKKTRQTTTQ